MENLDLQTILADWIPLGFGIVGVLILVVGLIKLISGSEKSFESTFSGIFIILIAVVLKWVMDVWLIDILFS
jgi:hypothetical protein